MATGQARTYNLANVVITVGGIVIEGFGESDAVSYEPNSPIWETTVGADGEVTRSATNDRSGNLTFTIMSTSGSLKVFSAFMAVSKQVAVGDIFPVFIKDLGSGDQLIAEQCWIEEEASMEFGKAAAEREWTVKAAKVSTMQGGALA
jgi:hypothetical protein